MFDWVFTAEGWAAFLALVSLEIVLGIDNIIFISILVARLPEDQRDKARKIGIGLAMVSRLVLLVFLFWIMGLEQTLFTVFDLDISGRDLILIGGGLFLLYKSTQEIHDSLEHKPEDDIEITGKANFNSVILQIAILDIVFSLDSVITAVGLVEQLSIMVIAIIVSVLVMLFAAKPIGEFVDDNPTVKMLALSFLLMVGVTLIAEGFGVHVPKGYIYFAMAFSFGVEMLNIRARKNQTKAMHLQKKISE